MGCWDGLRWSSTWPLSSTSTASRPGGPAPRHPPGSERRSALSGSLGRGGPHRFARERPPLGPPSPPCRASLATGSKDGGGAWRVVGPNVAVEHAHRHLEETIARKVALVPFLARCAHERDAMVAAAQRVLGPSCVSDQRPYEGEDIVVVSCHSPPLADARAVSLEAASTVDTVFCRWSARLVRVRDPFRGRWPRSGRKGPPLHSSTSP